MDEKEFNLWRLLEVVSQRIRFIVVFVLAAAVISSTIALILPKWYKATVLVIPPKEGSMQFGSGGVEEMISLTAGLVLPTRATPSDIYARILASRNMAERVIKANKLEEYYNIHSTGELYEKLAELSHFRVTEEGLLEIAFIDKDASKAAAIANSYATELDIMSRELSTSRARTTREFIGNRLMEVSRELDSARTALNEFQQKYKAIDLDRQTQLAIEAAVNLKVTLAENEIDLKIKEKTLSSSHPEVITLRRKVEEIKARIRDLEEGVENGSYLSLPVAEIPALKSRLAELTSRVKVSETLYEILSEQYEQAKIQEKMDTPAISILDKAYPPELPFKPRKAVIVLVSVGLSFIVSIILALFMNYISRLETESPDDYRRAMNFLYLLCGWIPGIKKKDRRD
jgi:uncharacterized protein involved in exopolysaccharide biosynthesis